MMTRRSAWLCAAGALLAALPARAGEVDRYLPDDAEMVLSVNVRRILDSDFFKRNVEPQARDALKGLDEAEDVLKDLGFDPFTDVDRVIAARPAGVDQDRGLVIVHGRFDLDKFRAKAEQAAKDEPDVLKIHKVNDGEGAKFQIYEVSPTDQADPVFVALPDGSTLLASPGKDYVVDALRKQNLKEKPALKNKDMQALLEHMDDKLAVSVAVVGDALREGAPDEVKELFEKIDAIGGGVSVGEEIKIEIVVSAKDGDDAKDLGEAAKDYLKQGRLMLAALAFAQSNQIDALLDVVNGVRVSVKDKTVMFKASVSSDVIDDALKKDK